MDNQFKTVLAEDEFYKFKNSVEGKGVPNEKLVDAFRASRKKFGHNQSASLDELRAMEKRGELAPTKSDAKEIDLPDSFWDSSATCKEGYGG
jgi:hypothetical protein